MFGILLGLLIPAAAMGIGLAAVHVSVELWLRSENAKARRSPLTGLMLRPPGYSLREKIDDLQMDLAIYSMLFMLVPLGMFTIHVTTSYCGGHPESLFRYISTVGVGLVGMIYTGYKWRLTVTDLRAFRRGLDGELHTASELDQIGRQGCFVFHDIPIDFGNIDHVVVTAAGVRLVDSKCLAKSGSGRDSANVIVDRGASILRFPDHDMPLPVEELEMQASWLSKRLTSAIGQPIEVEPTLALPGWFVKDVRRGRPLVINPKNSGHFFMQGNARLTPELIQQVRHQLDQLCRTVEPVGRLKKQWSETR